MSTTMTATDQMTSRARWLAALALEPVDRLPFWPKIGGAYQRAQKGRFTEMNVNALHEFIGSDKHEGVPSCFKETRTNSATDSRRLSDTSRQQVYRIGSYEMESTLSWDEDSQSWHPQTFPIKTREDLGRMAEFWRDATVEPSPENMEKADARVREIGEGGLRVDHIGESPLMLFVEHLAGVAPAHLFLADAPDEVEDLFDAIHQNLLRRAELTAEHGRADATYFIENTSTTLISPSQYGRYCFNHLKAYSEVLAAADRRVILHMCGLIKGLLNQLAKLPVRAFEAFTTPTLGNTTFRDGREVCPDTCLIGGTNAMLWLRPADEIIAQIHAHLDELPHHRGIVVTSAGVMPPFCTPETIRKVADAVKAYPLR